MSTHYLIDLFSDSISGVHHAQTGQSIVVGTYAIRIPFNVSVQNPFSKSNLITQKYQGILATYVGFNNIAYDDMLDGTGVDLVNSSGVSLGIGVGNSMFPGGVLQSNAVSIAGTPTSAHLTFELFEYDDADGSHDRFSRAYTEVVSTPGNVTAQVSFNGGSTYQTVLDGQHIDIAPVNAGSSLIVRFTNITIGRLFVGSWAVVY